jgi:hypothetical protein
LIRQIVQDFAVLEDNKIIQDDDKFLIVKAAITSEIGHNKDCMAYNPYDEIEYATWAVEVKVKLNLVNP